MRALLALPLLLLFASPAPAQTVFERALGTYGSTTDPAASCTANPHRLSFLTNPPHAVFDWAQPVEDPNDGPTNHARYDILGADSNSITLRREGEMARTDSGGPVIWVLRLTVNPLGYCWGRLDRPSVYCERQQERCEITAPSS